MFPFDIFVGNLKIEKKEANSEEYLNTNHFKVGLGLSTDILIYTFYLGHPQWFPKYCQILTLQSRWCPQRHYRLR